MRILLISGRGTNAEPHPSRAVARRLAAAFVARGHDVGWICPVDASEGFDPGPGHGEVEAVITTCPPFRAVQARLADLPTERALCRAIRRRLPDVVHVLAFGGGSSALLPWIADRLGAPAVVTVDQAESMCHRGTLVDAWGRTCEVHDDPERCRRCCTAPTPDGLSRRQALLARLLRPFPIIDPYPGRVDFENRLDLIVGGLVPAARVLVERDEHARELERLGLPRRRLTQPPRESSPAKFEFLYQEVAREYRRERVCPVVATS